MTELKTFVKQHKLKAEVIYNKLYVKATRKINNIDAMFFYLLNAGIITNNSWVKYGAINSDAKEFFSVEYIANTKQFKFELIV